MPRILALDIGERRIGLASGDTETRLAVPAGVIERHGTDDDYKAVVREATARDSGLILAGMPISLNGRLGPQAEITRAFIDRLREFTDIPIETRDERYSSAEAERHLREARPQQGRGKPGKASRGAVDTGAAAVILQSYLDSH
ncbi:MAG: Holliday junction resolvase RuvX [Dehalococcoidia bacterium]